MKKITIATSIATSIIALSLSSVTLAEKSSDEELDVLSAEASQTIMKEVTPTKPNEVEPAVDSTSSTDIDALSDAVAKKLSGILGAPDVDDEKKTEAKLEGLVSSSLLEGVKMDDLRSAVSAAMTDLAASEEDAEKVDKASKSLEKLIGSGSKSAKNSTDGYVKAQAKEATEFASSLKSPSAKVTKKVASIQSANRVIPETVTVEAGDSLYKIALRIYGDGYSFVRLYEANKDTIVDPNLVQIGQVLRVPR